MGPPKRAAELILVEGRARQSCQILEIVVGVEGVIAQKFKCDPVPLIGAAFEGRADNGTRGVAVFRGKVVGLYFELLDRVHRGHDGDAVPPDGTGVGKGVVVDSVEGDVDVGETAAPGDKGQVGTHAKDRSGIPYEQPEGERVAPVQRHIQDLLVVDHLAQGGADRIHQGRGAGNLDGLAYQSDAQGDMQVCGLIDLQVDSGNSFCFVAGRRHGDGVVAQGNERCVELTAIVGLGMAHSVGCRLGKGYLRIGNDAAGCILNHAGDGAGGDLCSSNGQSKRYEQQNSDVPG